MYEPCVSRRPVCSLAESQKEAETLTAAARCRETELEKSNAVKTASDSKQLDLLRQKFQVRTAIGSRKEDEIVVFNTLISSSHLHNCPVELVSE